MPQPELRYPCGPRPEPGAAREVAPGVLWLALPLPKGTFFNAWAVRDGDGWTVFDTGMSTPAAQAAWRALTAPGGPLQGLPITRLIATHLHADHVGLAGWLQEQYECPLWMTRTEYLQAQVMVAQSARPVPEALHFYRRAGWDAARLAAYEPVSRSMAPLPGSFRRIVDGERLRIGEHEWEVVVGSGHTPEHACFHCPALDLFLAGDQVLPLISSNVSVTHLEPEADPLRGWLDSLAMLRQRIPDSVLVLPAHDDPFLGMHARIDALADKRHRSLGRVREALVQAPRRAVELIPALFGRASFDDTFVQMLATGESIAYLNYLIARGEAAVADDGEGIAWYRAAG